MSAAKQKFRGGYTCECVAKSLPLLEAVLLCEGIISNSIDIFQLGYRTNVRASAGTHSRGGCTDVSPYSDAAVKIYRTFGWCAWHRTPAQGFSPHCHMFPNGCPHIASAGKYQQTDWNNGMNGLVGRRVRARTTGPGPIGRNTPSWQSGVRKMEAYLMAFKDDVAATVVAKMRGEYDDIAKSVLTADGLIPNSMTGNPANKFIGLNTGVEFTGRHLVAVEAAQAAQAKQLAAVQAAQKTQATQLAAIQKALADLATLVKGPLA